MESNSDLRSLLNHLIQTCKDGQEGFLTAAENATDASLRTLLSEYSLQRSRFAGELQSACHELGESNPEDASSIHGTVHRGWINLKSAVAHGDPHAVLVECERGESCAVAEYEKALKHEVPAPLRETISKQYSDILVAHARIRALSDSSGPAWA